MAENKWTKQQIKEYIKSPFHCPFCGSEEIVSMGINPDDGSNTATANVRCEHYDREWTEEYGLKNIITGD